MLISTQLNRWHSAALVLSMAAVVAGCNCGTSGRRDTAYYYSGTSAAGAPAQSAEYQTGTQATVTETSGSTEIPLYQESVVVGKREVDAGTVRLRKVVKTETVNQPVQIRTETVVVEREPGSGQPIDSSMQNKAFQEGETVIQLKREEPVVGKQVVESGRVVAQVKPEIKETTVSSQVRREEIDVQRSDMGGTSDPSGQAEGSYASAITDISTITSSSNPTSLAGRQVRLTGLKVDEVSNGRMIVVRSDDKPVHIWLRQPMNDLEKGDTINVQGTIRDATWAASSPALTESAKQTIQSEQVLIEAQRAEEMP